MKQWYEEIFENYASQYDKESFTQGTIGECDFIENEIKHDKSLAILDLGCGTGRHAIELSSRGYKVVGIDLSESMLQKAKEKALARNLAIQFQCGDARALNIEGEFDLVLMLCEAAFPLMETDEMNYAILQNAANALRPKGKLIFTTLNGLFPLFHSVKDFLASQAIEGNATYSENTFDLMTFRDHNTTQIKDDNGKQKVLTCNERYYVPSEITWLLKSLKFTRVDIFAAHLGAFSRDDALTPDDFEMLVIAVK